MKKTYRDGTDLQAIWLRQSKSPIPSPAKFQQLYVEKDRDGLIMAALHLVRLENAKTPEYMRDDAEMFAIRRAIEYIDKLLSRNNSGSVHAYLKQAIFGALCDCRTGRNKDARNCVTSAVRRYQPKPKPSDAKRDALVSEMRQRGLSDSMIESELDSLGLRPGSKLVTPVEQWPVDPVNGRLLEFGESFEPDQWTYLAEILTTEELDYCKLRAANWTLEEIENEFKVSLREQSAIFKRIQAKVQQRERDD